MASGRFGIVVAFMIITSTLAAEEDGILPKAVQ